VSKSEKMAVLTGKFAAQAIRMLGLGLGSNLPGRLARKVAPNVLSQLAKQSRMGVIAVTGTNGKSTTAGLLSSILREAGLTIVHNTQGANLVTGITATLVDAADWQGSIDADYCLFEIDEAALPVVANEVKIENIVVTNLFRDQLDRFGELDTTGKLIEKGIALNKSRAILNADDPNVSQLSPASARLFFGIESLSQDQEKHKASKPDDHAGTPPTGAKEIAAPHKPSATNAELAYCTNCASEVSYSVVYYGQLGKWSCTNCNRARPEPQVTATNIELAKDSSRFQITMDGVHLAVHMPLPGLFNVYNALAAAAAASLLDISHEAIRQGLKNYKTLFGRSEKVVIAGKQVLIQLIKNPAGTSQAVSSVVADSEVSVLIAINDNLADGRDISWLWDADFEQLGRLNRPIIVSGQRAHDMAVRMKYAGIDADKIICIPKLSKALDAALLQTKEGHTLRILPTYTCLLELQKVLKQRGLSLAGT
jgi:lipid II isoglutaminyl synthase (glutamine-hydrolysing)